MTSVACPGCQAAPAGADEAPQTPHSLVLYLPDPPRRRDPDRVRAASLAPGDLIVVPPGARLAADGVVTDGQSEIDRSLLTGETAPVAVAPGTELAAGEINLSGPLTLRVTAAGRDTRLARIADLVAAAENARSRYVTLGDRAARIYAPAVHLLALAAFLGWVWATGDARHALNVAVATLIITCPCALGLAVPAVSAAASGRLYRQGVLIKSGTALERLAEVDTAVFDKTGTLTEGRLRLREELAPGDLAVAAGLAQGSTHPLARVVAAAGARGIPRPRSPGCASTRATGSRAGWRTRSRRRSRGRPPRPRASTPIRSARWPSKRHRPRPAARSGRPRPQQGRCGRTNAPGWRRGRRPGRNRAAAATRLRRRIAAEPPRPSTRGSAAILGSAAGTTRPPEPPARRRRGCAASASAGPAGSASPRRTAPPPASMRAAARPLR